MKIDKTVGAGSQNITMLGIQLSGKTIPKVIEPISIQGRRLPIRDFVRSDHSPTKGSVITSKILSAGWKMANQSGFTASVVV